MFRITRGMHVQHIHFPVPVFGVRDLDDEGADDAPPADADRPQSAAPVKADAGETAAEQP